MLVELVTSKEMNTMEETTSSYYFDTALKEYREKHKMSQQELADILGTTKQVISRYETGKREPKLSVVQQYAEKLNIPLSCLLDGTPRISEIEEQFNPNRLSDFCKALRWGHLQLDKTEYMLLMEFRQLDQIRKGRILKIIDRFLD